MFGQLERHENFPSAHVPARHIDVWRPPGYQTDPGKKFAVLYMHDGQNLFNRAESFKSVDWGIVPALQKLIHAGAVPEIILVGIWNSEGKRWQEYLPQRPYTTPKGILALRSLATEHGFDPQRDIGKGPQSDAYLKFIIQELKPFIDGRYRTKPQREHTLIMGSSMGGLISLYALCQYPHLFAGAGCLSTHWPAVKDVIIDYLSQVLPPPGRHRIYFDYGTKTLDAQYEPYQKQVDKLLRAAGYVEGQDWITRRFPGADHSETAWRERVHIPLAFLLGSR